MPVLLAVLDEDKTHKSWMWVFDAPIASGVIEGAYRSLMRDRVDITFARWGLTGEEAVLKLRSSRAAGDLDDDPEVHAPRELDRIHLACFDDSELLDLRKAA